MKKRKKLAWINKRKVLMSVCWASLAVKVKCTTLWKFNSHMCIHVHSVFKSKLVEHNCVLLLFWFCWKYEHNRCVEGNIEKQSIRLSIYICLSKYIILTVQIFRCLLREEIISSQYTPYKVFFHDIILYSENLKSFISFD